MFDHGILSQTTMGRYGRPQKKKSPSPPPPPPPLPVPADAHVCRYLYS